jgi:predicted glutamine amidotransferase
MLKNYVHPFIQTQPTLVMMHNGKKINITDRFEKHFDIGVFDLI